MNRTDVLNHLAEKYQLKRYLEIGLQNPQQNFDKIKCEYKISVDPDPNAHASFCMTSDKFFSLTNDDLHDYGWASLFKVHGKKDHYWSQFDLVFIDGMHTAEQVQKDFENALKVLAPNGFIVLHDCNPEKEEHTIVPRPTKSGHWNGDVYRFALTITSKVFSTDPAFTVDLDNGITIFSGHQEYRLHGFPLPYMEWEDFDAHRKELLNLITWDEFVQL